MKREELIEHCENQIKMCEMWAISRGEEPSGKVYEEHKLILELLKQEPCEDAISRGELLKAIDTWDKFGCDADTKLVSYQDHYIPYIHYDDVVKCIKGMPSVKPQEPRRKGKWIDCGVSARCSICGCKDHEYSKHHYCPNCGAKMIEPQESEDKE